MSGMKADTAEPRGTAQRGRTRPAGIPAGADTARPEKGWYVKMEYARLGSTGMWVSRLCLGTMNFGPNTSEKEAFRIMDAALDAGINFFDCANMYGWNPHLGGRRGTTEEILGRWFAQGGGRREKVVLSTKVFARMEDPNDGPNDTPGLSAYKIRRHLDASLQRLKTDHVELYYMHEYDPDCSWAELWDTLETERNAGKLFYAGASNFKARQLCYAQAEAQKRHILGLACAQFNYNLVNRLPEEEVIPAAGELGLGCVVWSPLGGGYLTGSPLKPVTGEQRSKKYAGKLSDASRKQLEDYKKVCEDFGASEANVALAWILHDPRITGPIIGPRTCGQLSDLLKCAELKLPEDMINRLNDIFPSPMDLLKRQ